MGDYVQSRLYRGLRYVQLLAVKEEWEDALVADLIDAPAQFHPRTPYWVEVRYRYGDAEPWQRLPNPAQDGMRPRDLPAQDEQGRPLQVTARVILNAETFPTLEEMLPGVRPEQVHVMSLEWADPCRDSTSDECRLANVLARLALERAHRLQRLELHGFALDSEATAALEELPALREYVRLRTPEEADAERSVTVTQLSERSTDGETRH